MTASCHQGLASETADRWAKASPPSSAAQEKRRIRRMRVLSSRQAKCIKSERWARDTGMGVLRRSARSCPSLRPACRCLERPQMSVFHARRRLGWLHVANETGAWLRPAGELPPQDIEKAAHLGSVGIEEALPVKVPRKWQCAGGMLHRFLFTHSFRAGWRVSL